MHATARIAAASSCVLLAALVAGGVDSAAMARPAGQPATSTVGQRADFNGDGRGDLAVGVPGEDLGSASNAGGVNVIYGTASGLAAQGNQFWSQDSSGVQGTAEPNDAFGQAVAVGDFNNDGYSDLAVAAPFDGVAGLASAGAVNVLYGSAGGLVSTGNQQWTQASKGVKGAAKAQSEFGLALVTGDFDNDGFSDLAIGAPGDIGSAGSVTVLYGSAHGLAAKGSQRLKGNFSGDRFGASLAAGNFDAAAGIDLAVGAPGATNNGVADAGEVFWMLGTPKGLRGFNFTLNSVVLPGAHCGAALTSLNWDNDASGRADVAAGCPDGAVNGLKGAGIVDLHLGTGTGLSNGIGELASTTPQAGAAFGSALAAGDLGDDHGGSDDLVVGEPLFDLSGLPDVGRVVIVTDNDGAGFEVVRQGLDGTFGKGEAGDLFGAAVTTGNFDGDGWADLAVGVPGEGLGTKTDGEGGVNVLYGSSNGLTTQGQQFWSQHTSGIVGTAEAEDFFGDAMSGRHR